MKGTNVKIAVAATGNDLSAAADPRFGRCAFFVVVDSETGAFQAFPNTAAAQGSGAGIAAAQLVGNTDAEAVVAGQFGPNAFQALSAAGIRILQGGAGTVAEVVEAAKNGALQELGGASVAAHYGTGGAGAGMGVGAGAGGGMGAGAGMGMGMGGGGGRGMGGGGGRGMGGGGGRGMGGGMGMGAAPMAAPAGDSLDELTGVVRMLSEQLADMQMRLAAIETKLQGD